jgi:hypothetical protein
VRYLLYSLTFCGEPLVKILKNDISEIVGMTTPPND